MLPDRESAPPCSRISWCNSSAHSAQLIEVAWLDADVHMIGLIVAVDAMITDQRIGHLQRLDGQVEEPMRSVAAHLLHQGLLRGRESEDGLSTAAPGKRVAHESRLQQHHAVAALREV